MGADSNKIKPIINIDIIRKFQSTFKNFSGMDSSFIDLDSNFIIDAAGKREFCLQVANLENKTFLFKCRRSDYCACKKIVATKKYYIYKCHAGLTDIIVPIFINDEIVGAIITGQIRKNGDTFLIENFSELDKTAKDKLKHFYLQVPEFTEERIQACAEFIFLMINYIVKSEYQLLSYTDLPAQSSYIKETIEKAIVYIKEHFKDSDISLNKVADELHLSTFYFSHIFNKELQTTFVDFITKIRLEESLKLFKEQPQKSIKEIAFNTGYEDPYYFSKVFRKVYKISPTQFRKQFSA